MASSLVALLAPRKSTIPTEKTSIRIASAIPRIAVEIISELYNDSIRSGWRILFSEKIVAPPTPSNKPRALKRLKMGRARLSAVNPNAPAAIEIKRV